MGFTGQNYAFDSPAAAVAGMVARLGINRATLCAEQCPLDASWGRILAQAVTADRDSPAFDYAAMDGYALRMADLIPAVGPSDTARGVMLPVSGEARIGEQPPHFPDSAPSAIRIVTGAALPPGSDAVVRREDVVEHPTTIGCAEVASITISPGAAAAVRTGDHIRRRGENARAGDEALAVGTILSPAALGTLAAVGRVRPSVYTRLRVTIISNGDELVHPDTIPGPFQVRDSNTTVIRALLAAHPWIEVVSATHVRDESEQLEKTIRNAIARADALVLTAGVSMGHRDPTRAAIQAVGADIIFHGLPQRPGKPMLAAVALTDSATRVPIFGLPGNPISAMVTCTRIVLPVLAACAGATRSTDPPRVALAYHDGKALDLWWHRLVRINDSGAPELIDGHGSGDIIAGGRSDGFIEAPPGAVGDATITGAIPLYPFYPWPT